MAKPKPYRKTPVSIDQSKADMLRLMRNYDVLDPYVEVERPNFIRQGGQRTAPLQSVGGSIVATFQWPGMATSARYTANLKEWQQGQFQTAEDFRRDVNQELKIAGRTMFYSLKSTFEAIAAGHLREQVALFSWTVLPDGSTVADKPDVELTRLVVNPDTPLLMAKAGPDARGFDITKRDR